MANTKAVGKKYSSIIKGRLGRYANWPINDPLALGQIGIYHGKTASFSWCTSLAELGVYIDPQPDTELVQMDELYTSRVRAEFTLDPEIPLTANACFRFTRASGIALQAYEMSCQRLPLDALAKELNRVLGFDSAQWNRRHVIVTRLWNARSFTALLSESRSARARVSANIAAGMGPIFNVADPNLDVGIAHFSDLAYRGISSGCVPFFGIHRLVYRRDKYHLKQYAGNKFAFWF